MGVERTLPASKASTISRHAIVPESSSAPAADMAGVNSAAMCRITTDSVCGSRKARNVTWSCINRSTTAKPPERCKTNTQQYTGIVIYRMRGMRRRKRCRLRCTASPHVAGLYSSRRHDTQPSGTGGRKIRPKTMTDRVRSTAAARVSPTYTAPTPPRTETTSMPMLGRWTKYAGIELKIFAKTSSRRDSSPFS